LKEEVVEKSPDQYLKRLSIPTRILKGFEELFNYWKHPWQVEQILKNNAGQLQSYPNYLEILDSESFEEERIMASCHETHYIGYDPDANLCQIGLEYIKELYPLSTETVSTGAIYYPANSYMKWHTNSDACGTRVYVSWSDESDKNFFKYKIGDQIFTDYDKAGVNVREFKVTKEPPFWHCVGCSTQRLSFGYWIL